MLNHTSAFDRFFSTTGAFIFALGSGSVIRIVGEIVAWAR